MANFFVFFGAAIFAVLGDRLAKWLMTDYFVLPHVLGGGFSLQLVRTQSFLFSPIPDGLIVLFVSLLVLLLVIWLGYRFGIWEEWAGNLAYGLMLGAMGSNLFDRLSYGYILDWLSWRGVGAFNAADFLIVVGFIILIVMIWRRR
jgi:lipoprotein signal peptidase